MSKNDIVKVLEKNGFDITKQAIGIMDQLGRDDDKKFAEEFCEWYKKLKSTITLHQVIQFVDDRRREIEAKEEKKVKQK